MSGREGLTVRGLPAHGVEVAAAVVEHELVLRAPAPPLQQWHEVMAVQRPEGTQHKVVKTPAPLMVPCSEAE